MRCSGVALIQPPRQRERAESAAGRGQAPCGFEVVRAPALHAAAANQTHRASRSLNTPLADPDALPAPRSRYPTPARDPGADKERYGCEGEAVKPMEPMEPMEPCKAEATRPDEGTSSDETVRSNEGARSDERTPSDEGTCSDESAAHADAGSMEA